MSEWRADASKYALKNVSLKQRYGDRSGRQLTRRGVGVGNAIAASPIKTECVPDKQT